MSADENRTPDSEDPARTYAIVASVMKEMMEDVGYTGVVVTPAVVPDLLAARLLQYAEKKVKLGRLRKALKEQSFYLECRSDQGAFGVLECDVIIAYDLAGSGVRPSQMPSRAGDDALNILWSAAIERQELEALRLLLEAAKSP